MTNEPLTIGWASADITPAAPVQLAGQFHVRISEGVLDPVTATALALSSGVAGSARSAIMVSCDRVGIPYGLLTAVRERVREALPELDPCCVYLNATHTHTAPHVAVPSDYDRLGGGASAAGIGGYLPTERAIAGKSYGAVPASTPVGPEGGQELAEWILQTLHALWAQQP